MRASRSLAAGALAVLALVAGTAALAAPTKTSCPPEPAPLSADRLAAQAKDRGLMWTLKRDGQTSYLYASLHVGKPGWAAPGPRLRKALDEVDAVALELDPLDRDAWKMPPMPELPLDAAMRQRLDAQATAVCLEPRALAALHPLLQTSTYMLLRARSLGLDVRYGQEMLLSQWARDRGLPVLALETLQGQLEALLPADEDAARRELRSNLQQLERPKSLLRTLDTMVGVYDRGDLARLNRYADWCDCVTDASDRAALQRINDGRNPALAQRISELHQRGQSLLVAVGAMHMTGPRALTTLLKDQGFEVTLMPRTASR
ncbi:TraB/GumN family protein [Mitsuaria sp. 7]|uniref:TraB/GumN family protein n=1 Tax=Mitsuaria sp. 7 TaxID=1658665 RepID=UPI0012F961CE|nr:TraB/GumN family protein [Mitsuaria sp. 7]